MELSSLEYGAKLIVRECYIGIADIVMQLNEEDSGVIVTGNPGIGKSFFLLFYVFIKKERPKCYHSSLLGCREAVVEILSIL